MSSEAAAAAQQGGRILSIQSHVVSGYVGNKSATFPLQLLGYEVDAINSVQFSNHTGYANGIRGQRLQDVELWDLVEGLLANDIAGEYSHVINGYIGAPSFLEKLAEVVKKMKELNPGLTYVCDPVMGDFGPGMYVPESLLPLYRETIVPLADVCVPNQFEAELIVERKIRDEGDAFAAMDAFHGMGVETVILSSTELNQEMLVALASTKSRPDEAVRIYIPKFPAAFVGTGDLFTALATAWLSRTGNDLVKTLENTIGTMQAVLKRTLEHARSRSKGDQQQQASARDMELKLIQSKRDIEEPTVTVRAERIKRK